MVDVSDWSDNPDDNSTVDGINIAEDCPASNVNGGMRSIMAGVKTMFLSLPTFSSLMPKSGGVFSGDISRDSRGAYQHNADSTLTDGRNYYLAEGSDRPESPGPGVTVFYYSA